MDGPQGTGLPAPGDRIADKYDVIRVVGEGGMGVVYEVVHTRLQQRAAIKMLQPRVQAMPDVAARFEREARAACRLRSRHAVRITDVDHDDAGRAFMVMEFLDGHDLAEELHARGRLPVAEAVDIVIQACVAMAEAHASGVVHRDLKPSNLFLVNEGGERVVKVLDFGISKMTTDGEAAVTSTFATMGTPLYMSPEQIRSTKNVDGRTDIWSLGVLLFEALAGERPFQGTTTAAAAAIVADEPPLLRSLVPEVPEGVEAAVVKALSKKPEERFRDARGLVEALAPFGTNRDALRAIDAAVPAHGASGRPPAPRVSSTPSFAHATTLAQTTPPPQKGTLLSPRAVTTPAPHVKSPRATTTPAAGAATPPQTAPLAPPAPSTEAAWATQRTSAGRAGRATRLAAGLGALAIVVFAVVRMRGASTPSAPVPSAASVTQFAPPSPPPTAFAIASAPPLPAVTSASSAGSLSPTPAESAVPHRLSPKPHGDRQRPVSSGAPGSTVAAPPVATPAPASAAPAATNPLHL